jgi:hypothetical protein
MPAPQHRASAFGICWRADLPLPEFFGCEGADCRAFLGNVDVRRVETLADRAPLRIVNKGMVFSDGVRFAWRDEAAFDMFAGERIDYMPLAQWRGKLPSAFYSTMAALTAAWRGAVPMHASAVEIDGRAFLIAGRSGAGKSSLAAGVVALGARFVADDLSVVRVSGGNGQIELFRGRPDMRQHADTAHQIAATARSPIAGDSRGKWLVRPAAATREESLRLAGILLLEKSGSPVGASGKAALLASNLYRPRWMAALPSHARIRRDLLALAAGVRLDTFPCIGTFDPAVENERAEQALGLLRAMAAR